MKPLNKLFFYFVILTCSLNVAQSQDPREDEIRRLENLERESVLNSDTSALYGKIWSNDMTVNTPANVVGTVDGTKAQLRKGNLNYLSFERDIEKISFHGNVAIVMGEERIQPQGEQIHAGKLVTRRFTNVWLFEENNWTIIARQATIIRIE